jgi:hypothetical protein
VLVTSTPVLVIPIQPSQSAVYAVSVYVLVTGFGVGVDSTFVSFTSSIGFIDLSPVACGAVSFTNPPGNTISNAVKAFNKPIKSSSFVLVS